MRSRAGWESNHCLPTPISGFRDPTGFEWKSPGASAEYGCTPLCPIRLPPPPPPASQLSSLSCPPFLSRCGLDSIWLLPIFKPHHRAKTLPGQVPKGLNQDLLLHTGGALSFRAQTQIFPELAASPLAGGQICLLLHTSTWGPSNGPYSAHHVPPGRTRVPPTLTTDGSHWQWAWSWVILRSGREALEQETRHLPTAGQALMAYALGSQESRWHGSPA